ncbi:MAG: SDR family NAD(P)-dependent oxidoreductase [Ignavibacteria bacterium]|nr:SDR family NAD(P)-dependent oxidoreductase [Ignavibacteria bacterium]
MENKICIITGANAGIGKEAAIQIASTGHKVILGCRNKLRGEAALNEVKQKSKNNSVELFRVDMSIQESIREFTS